MKTYTVFCRELVEGSTTFISSAEAATMQEAAELVRQECIAAWEYQDHPEDVHILGVAEGDVSIIEWNDDIL